jgi:hypothetical protein
MILGYAARNAISPKVNSQHLQKFQDMAHREDPSLKAQMGDYHGVGGQIASRIEGLDQDRRRMAHEDLNQNLLGPVSAALASGKAAQAVQAIRGHLQKLAQQHGVPLPQMGAPAPGAMGGLKPPGM